ncbi:RAD protein (Pv-fam-e) [Plasmodium vivax Brazil I]|uniref:RAD protein (Pv-fam-e) n=1 Tax=Plasmodium vivax (strain Brazil I) TaxID=1033975 RepID=A0A0J9SZB6_PLAV1|nr:RAD protein (Pv-fam-e) [Plasmodium vivax Brazil I]
MVRIGGLQFSRSRFFFLLLGALFSVVLLGRENTLRARSIMALSNLKPSGTRWRKLAETSHKLRKVKSESNVSDYKGKQEDERSKAANEEGIKKQTTRGAAQVDKQKATTTFDHYNERFKKKFEAMCSEVWKNFMLLAKNKRMPHDYRLKFVMEYNEAAKEEIEQTFQFSKRRFYIFMRKRIIWLSEFDLFMKRTKNIWNTIMKHHVDRWSKILLYRLDHYKD